MLATISNWIADFTSANGPANVLAIAAIALVAVALVVAARALAVMFTERDRERAVPVRVRARRVPANRQIDPDAAGRPRPRAPGDRF
jgi:hypothetical protein